MSLRQKMRLAFLASGQGSNFESIVKACQSGQLCAEPVLLITSSFRAKALERAKKIEVKYQVIEPKGFANRTEWDQTLLQALQKVQPDLVLAVGFAQKIGPLVLRAFPQKIWNMHPSLLPAYGGAGMYGRKVHEAVLAGGEVETGLTLHIVTEEYDRGPILAQKRLAIEAGETPESLEAKIKQMEHEFWVESLRAMDKA